MSCYGRKKLLLVAGFLSVLAISGPELFSQSEGSTEDDRSTKGWSNGRTWEGLDFQSQIMYIHGIETGVSLFAYEYAALAPEVNQLLNTPWHLHAELIIKGFRFSDLAKEVSLFYEERTNIRIPIAYAYVYVVKKAHGEDPSELARYASELRSRWNQ